MVKKKIEEKYKEMTDIEHVLFRPGMYVGSTKKEIQNGFLYNIDKESFEETEYQVVPAMLKVVDEIISNSCDEFRRTDNFGLTEILVEINSKEGYIEVIDNGGISVVKHKEAGCWLPEFIFGRLRTSSNYDDNEDRSGVGTNGVGSSIANIFSTKFIIETADGKNRWQRSWTNNMSILNDDLVVSKCKKTDHFTRTRMYLDFKQFNNNTLNGEFARVILTRCINAAVANKGIIVKYKDDCYAKEVIQFSFSSLKDYIKLYDDVMDGVDDSMLIGYEDADKSIVLVPNKTINVGFVNGAICSNGTHIRAIRNVFNEELISFIKKKHKIDVTNRNCDNGYSLFCEVTISNPSYDSQTKDTLTTPVTKFYKDTSKKFEISDKVVKSITSSEIVQNILDWYRQKSTAEDAKILRKLNRAASKELKRPDKFIDAASKNPSERQLWIFEGDSAKAAFRTCRNPQTQAGLIMRGVPKCSFGLKPTQIMQNEVYNDIVSVTGLKFGEEFDLKNLKFSKIVISSDMDVDGHHIAGILQQFFSNWPQLFELGIVVRSISPIIIAKKGKISKAYYSFQDYKKDESKLKGYTIKYAKGLGGLNMEESKKMYQEPHFEEYKLDENTDSTFELWFSDDPEKRKKTLI
jgi:DNA gyrase/topoisomerase IV subunit B